MSSLWSRPIRYERWALFGASIGAVLVWPLVLALLSVVFYVIALPIRLLGRLFRHPSLRSVVTGGGMALAGGMITYVLNQPVVPGRSEEIVIHQGMTTRAIARTLKERKLIRNVFFFRFLTQWIGADGQLQAGEYRLYSDQTTRSIIRTLAKGKTSLRRVTLPEGLTCHEIAGILSREVGVDSMEFIQRAYDRAFCKQAGIEAPSMEGYLFPDTYLVAQDLRAPTLIAILLARFHAVFDDSLKERARQMGFTVHEILTLASIIEREAHVEQERPIISGVFHRRLESNMPLEADPTVEYALGRRKKQILYSDLEVDSPYNTYLYPGLPPGPICNPGRASILAALYPLETPYLYFVAKGDGTHVFTSSDRAHISVKQYLRRPPGT